MVSEEDDRSIVVLNLARALAVEAIAGHHEHPSDAPLGRVAEDRERIIDAL